jgi:hypothetical protein
VHPVQSQSTIQPAEDPASRLLDLLPQCEALLISGEVEQALELIRRAKFQASLLDRSWVRAIARSVDPLSTGRDEEKIDPIIDELTARAEDGKYHSRAVRTAVERSAHPRETGEVQLRDRRQNARDLIGAANSALFLRNKYQDGALGRAVRAVRETPRSADQRLVAVIEAVRAREQPGVEVDDVQSLLIDIDPAFGELSEERLRSLLSKVHEEPGGATKLGIHRVCAELSLAVKAFGHCQLQGETRVLALRRLAAGYASAERRESKRTEKRLSMRTS